MPFGPVRFLHAANLWIDHALSGTGPLPDAQREEAEEATGTAFDRVVTAAIEHEVDFLLLAGNVFDDEDRSVRARVALRDGFDRLEREQIRVFVTPGQADPSAAWRDIPHLPENVTILFPDDRESVAVIQEGRVIASVAAGRASNERLPPRELSESSSSWEAPPSTAPSQTDRPDHNSRQGPFAVAMTALVAPSAKRLNAIPCDYIALGGDGSRQTISTTAGIAHHPGSTQGMSLSETGPHGCTLVEVDEDRRINTRFVPTASVRWENLTVAVHEKTTREELREQMGKLFSALSPESTETLWLVTWQVTGCGCLLDAIDEDESLRLELTGALEPQTESDGPRPALVHCFRLIPRLSVEEPNREDSAAVDSAAVDPTAVDPVSSNRRLAAEYARMSADEQLLSPELLDECLEAVAGLDPAHTDRLRSLLPKLDRETIDATIDRLGRNWFAPTSEKEGRYENG